MGVPTAATIPSRRERNAGDETDNCESRQAATDKSFALVLCPSSEFSICAWTEQENVRNDVGEVAACFDEGSRGSSDLRRSRTSLNPRPGVSLFNRYERIRPKRCSPLEASHARREFSRIPIRNSSVALSRCLLFSPFRNPPP